MIRKSKNGFYYEFMKYGKRYYGVCVACETLQQAEAFEKNLRDDIVAVAGKKKTILGVYNAMCDAITEVNAILLDDAMDAFLMKPSKRIPSENENKKKFAAWNDFVAFMKKQFPEIKSISNVTRSHAEQYIAFLRQHGVFDKAISYQRSGVTIKSKNSLSKISPRTINIRHRMIKAIFSALQQDAGIVFNPFDFPMLENKSISRDIFSDDELRRIGDEMTMPFIKPIFIIGICTGLTLGDICLLQWDSIANGFIITTRRKTGVSLEIPILPPLASFLAAQRENGIESKYVSPELAELYLRQPSAVTYRIRKFLDSIGIKSTVTVTGRQRAVSTKAAHAMRHTFAYLAGVYNIPQPIVQGVLGHMSQQMTELYQRHARREQKELFFRRMPNLLGESQTVSLRQELHNLIDSLPEEKLPMLIAQLNQIK